MDQPQATDGSQTRCHHRTDQPGSTEPLDPVANALGNRARRSWTIWKLIHQNLPMTGADAPHEHLGEAATNASGEHTPSLRTHRRLRANQDAMRSGSSSRTAVASERRATQSASISMGMRKYAPR